jgi:hypothetical protein
LIDLEMLNIMPVNEKARRFLGMVGMMPDPACLYSVQIAKWGYEKGGIVVEASVSETIEAMFSWSPVRIVNFFMMDMAGDGYSPRGWQEAEKPLDFALVLLNDVEEKVLIHFPWYGSV